MSEADSVGPPVLDPRFLGANHRFLLLLGTKCPPSFHDAPAVSMANSQWSQGIWLEIIPTKAGERHRVIKSF